MNLKLKLKDIYTRYYKSSVLLKRFTNVFSLDVLVRGSNLFLLPIYLKLMSQDEFGLYGYIFSIVSIFSLVLNFGLYLSQVKLYHDYTGKERGALLFTINITLLAGLVLLIAPVYLFHFDGVLVSLLFQHVINYAGYRSLILMAILVTVYVTMLQNFLMTSENIKKYQLYNFLKLVLVNSVVIYILSFRSSDSVMVRLKFGYGTEAIMLSAFLLYYVRQMKPIFRPEYVVKAIKIGFPAMMSALLGTIYNFSDKYILEKYGNFSDIAVYSLGFTLASIISMIFVSFQTVFLPFFYKEKDIEKNFNKTKAIVLRMIGIFAALGVFIFIGTKAALAFHIIQPKYAPVLAILPILLLTQIVQSIVFLYSNYIVYFEVVYVGTIIVLVLSFINVGSNLLLIPRYNIMGASISAFITTMLSLAIYYQYVKRKCAAAILKGQES